MKIKKIQDDSVFTGTLAGFAYAMGIQTWIVRVGFILLLALSGQGFAVAVLYWIVSMFLPDWEQDPEDYDEVCN